MNKQPFIAGLAAGLAGLPAGPGRHFYGNYYDIQARLINLDLDQSRKYGKITTLTKISLYFEIIFVFHISTYFKCY